MNRPYTLEEIKSISIPVAKEYGVKKLALFGSYARGEPKAYSDIDFLIDKGNIIDLFMLSGFINALQDSFGVHVDVLTYDSLPDSLAIDNINDEVVLYEG